MRESEEAGVLLQFKFRCPVCGIDMEESSIIGEPRYACTRCEMYLSTQELHDFYGGAANVGL